jgi:hypothetical protein
MMETPMR